MLAAPSPFKLNDPSLADFIVHFVGRRRGDTRLPDEVAGFTAEQRLNSVLVSGMLIARSVPHSFESRVVCASDLARAELEAAFRDGLNGRGALEPWALVLDRARAWSMTMRPVIYEPEATADALRASCEAIYRCPDARGRVVQTRINSSAYDRDDWLHEREWRWWPHVEEEPLLDIEPLIRAVVVPSGNWGINPHGPLPEGLAARSWGSASSIIERWVWLGYPPWFAHGGFLELPWTR